MTDKFTWDEKDELIVTSAGQETDPVLLALQAEIDRVDEILRTATIVGEDFVDEFNPGQPRDQNGRWTSGGAGGGGSAPLVQQRTPGRMESHPSNRGSVELRRALDDGTATRASIVADPSFQAAAAELYAQPETHKMPGYGTEDNALNRKFEKGLVGRDAAVDYLFEDSAVLAYGDDKSSAQPVEQGFRATILTGAPAAGKSTVADPHARALKARIIDSDEAKKLIPEFRGGIGANAVHEESSTLIDPVYARAIRNGDNMVIPKVGDSASSIEKHVKRLQAAGYKVTVAFVDTDPDEAWRRMASRWISTGRLIPPNYMTEAAVNPKGAFRSMVSNNLADEYVHIDNNPGYGKPRKMFFGNLDGVVTE